MRTFRGSSKGMLSPFERRRTRCLERFAKLHGRMAGRARPPGGSFSAMFLASHGRAARRSAPTSQWQYGHIILKTALTVCFLSKPAWRSSRSRALRRTVPRKPRKRRPRAVGSVEARRRWLPVSFFQMSKFISWRSRLRLSRRVERPSATVARTAPGATSAFPGRALPDTAVPAGDGVSPDAAGLSISPTFHVRGKTPPFILNYRSADPCSLP